MSAAETSPSAAETSTDCNDVVTAYVSELHEGIEDALQQLGWVFEMRDEDPGPGWRAPDGRFFETALSQPDILLPVAVKLAAARAAEVRTIDEVKKEAVARAMIAHSGNVPKAAAALGIGQTTLYRWLAHGHVAPLLGVP